MTSASSSSSNSSSRATSRNYSYVIKQGFWLEPEDGTSEEVPPRHYLKVLSLESEWKLFRSLIVKITGLTPVAVERLPWESFQHLIDPSATPENGHTLYKNEHTLDFVAEFAVPIWDSRRITKKNPCMVDRITVALYWDRRRRATARNGPLRMWQAPTTWRRTRFHHCRRMI